METYGVGTWVRVHAIIGLEGVAGSVPAIGQVVRPCRSDIGRTDTRRVRIDTGTFANSNLWVIMCDHMEPLDAAEAALHILALS